MSAKKTPASACQSHPKRPDLAVGSFPSEQVKGGPVKVSKMGRRRALVLILVHVAVFLHILHWQLSGESLAPLEPSEAMFTVANGTVNAGLILLLLSFVTTLVLGRFFCGWACHLVALQDLSAWLLRKVGIRPRPLRSRWLMLVPLLAGLHLFLWPAVARWAQGAPSPELHTEFTKTDFWETFPGFWIGLLTFAVCGFAMIYVLGAKGFCTYACPYGGLFGVMDRFAPGRIRVTDDCKHCGHCTAVCTSNVLVHKEVHDFGSVVDPGCMKCMDCVSACPEGALKFGFGKPAVATKARHKPSRLKPSFTLREELAMVGIFIAAMAILRGMPSEIAPWSGTLYQLMPSFLALGISATSAFILIYAWRLLRRPEVRMQGWVFRDAGKLTGKGKIFGACAAILLAFFIHSGVVQGLHFAGRHALDSAADANYEQIVWDQDEAAMKNIPQAVRANWDRAEALLLKADSLGLVHDPRIGRAKAWFAMCRHDLSAAQAILEAEVAHNPKWENNHAYLGRLLILQGDYEQGVDRLIKATELSTGKGRFSQALYEPLHRAGQRGNKERALGLANVILDRMPADPPALRLAAQTVALTGEVERAADALAQERIPDSIEGDLLVDLLVLRGSLLANLKRHKDAREVFAAAHELRPKAFIVHYSLAEQCYLAGDKPAARREIEAIIKLHPADAKALLFLAQLEQEAGRSSRAAELRAQAQRLMMGGR